MPSPQPLPKTRRKANNASSQSSYSTKERSGTVSPKVLFLETQKQQPSCSQPETQRKFVSAPAPLPNRPEVQNQGHKMADVNINNPWAAWSALQPQAAARFWFDFSPSTAAGNPLYDEQVDSQVKQILTSSVHNLAKGNVQAGIFPFKYVLRGPEKRQESINSITLSEHLWGMFSIIDDPEVDPSIKPELMRHIQHIVEDEVALSHRYMLRLTISRAATNATKPTWTTGDSQRRPSMPEL